MTRVNWKIFLSGKLFLETEKIDKMKIVEGLPNLVVDVPLKGQTIGREEARENNVIRLFSPFEYDYSSLTYSLRPFGLNFSHSKQQEESLVKGRRGVTSGEFTQVYGSLDGAQRENRLFEKGLKFLEGDYSRRARCDTVVDFDKGLVIEKTKTAGEDFDRDEKGIIKGENIWEIPIPKDEGLRHIDGFSREYDSFINLLYGTSDFREELNLLRNPFLRDQNTSFEYPVIDLVPRGEKSVIRSLVWPSIGGPYKTSICDLDLTESPEYLGYLRPHFDFRISYPQVKDVERIEIEGSK